MWNDIEVSKIELFEKFTQKHGGYVMSNEYLHFYELVYQDIHISYHYGNRNENPYFYISSKCNCDLNFTLKTKPLSLGETFGNNQESHKYKNYTVLSNLEDLCKIQKLLNDPRVKKYDHLLEKYPITIENQTMMVYRKFSLYMATLSLDTLEQSVHMFEEMREIIEYYTRQF